MDSSYTTLFFFYLFACLVWGIVVAFLFRSRGQSALGGFFAGFFLGIFSLIIYARLPDKNKAFAGSFGLQNPPGSAIPYAGALDLALPGQVCPNCGWQQAGAVNFCGRCGFNLASLPPQATSLPGQAAAVPGAQRFLRAGIAAVFLTVFGLALSPVYPMVFNRISSEDYRLIATGISMVTGIINWMVVVAIATYPDIEQKKLLRAALAGVATAIIGAVVDFWFFGAAANNFGEMPARLVVWVLSLSTIPLALLILEPGKLRLARAGFLLAQHLVNLVQNVIYIQVSYNTSSIQPVLTVISLLNGFFFALAITWLPLRETANEL